MSASSQFQRARQPAQKEQRRRELLAAAATLIDEGGLDAVSLTAIARAAGLSKSNVYRYFESREEILLHLLLDDERAAVADLEKALAPLAGSGDVDAVCARLAEVLSRHTRMCELIAVVANVLEHNLSRDTVAAFKEQVLEVSIRIGNALHAALPALPHDQTFAFLRYLHALIAGLWPMGHPAPVAAEVMADEIYAGFRCDFPRDLAGGLTALVRGLVAST